MDSDSTGSGGPGPDPKPGAFAFQKLVLERSIRVMVLQPAHLRTAQLEAILQEVQLDDKPEYEALSYAWGDDAPSETLAIDSGTMMVTASLAAALRQFRPHDQSRTVWVDAICINQKDNHEKSQQVAQMADVYKLASRALIWLGENTTDTAAVFQFLATTAGRSEEFGLQKTLGSWIFFEKKLDGVDPNALRSLLQPPLHIKLADVFSRSWFTRLWIIQEVVLPPASVIHCGAEMLDWTVFSTAMAVIMAAISTAGAAVRDLNAFLTAWHVVDLVAS